MGTSLLQLTIVLATATIMINGLTVNASDILASATEATNMANTHQISTALELYRLDHDTYPVANNGTDLMNILFTEGYIKSMPNNPTIFQYKIISNGNNYTLSL